jgi:hypothetical protein
MASYTQFRLLEEKEARKGRKGGKLKRDGKFETRERLNDHRDEHQLTSRYPEAKG